jgi:excisionase family DNA binding protein
MKGITIIATLSAETIEIIAQRASAINNEKLQSKPNEKYKKIFFTVIETSKMIGVSEQTLTRHIRSGLLQASKPGKNYLISKENINLYLNINND